MSDKKECPIWNYQASGVNWIYNQRGWESGKLSFLPEYYHVSEGMKMHIITSIASTIEGSLRSFLINTIHSYTRRFLVLEKLIRENNFSNQNEGFSFRMTKKECLDELNETKKVLLKIFSKYSNNDNHTYEKKVTLRFCKRIFEIKLDIWKRPTDDFEKRPYEIIEVIRKSTWNDLIHHYRNIMNERLRVQLKKKDKKLMEDIEKIFQFRNFFAHSNNIQMNFSSTENAQFENMSKTLDEYLKNKNFIGTNSTDYYFIQRMVPDKLVNHFKQCLDIFLDCDFFKNNSSTLNTSQQIWKP